MPENQRLIVSEIPDTTCYVLNCATCGVLLSTVDHSPMLLDRLLLEIQAISHSRAYSVYHDVCGYKLGSGGYAESPYRGVNTGSYDQ